MATVNFIKYKKQSAGALSGVTQYVSRMKKHWTKMTGNWSAGRTARPSWPTGSSRPPAARTARTAPSGSTTTSSPFLRTR